MDIRRRPGREGTLVRLEGVLDSSVSAELLQTAVPVGAVLFDLGGLTDCSSEGFETWCQVLASKPNPERAIVRCPPAFLDHLNHAHAGAAGGVLVSLLVTATCTDGSCAAELPLLADLRLDRVRLSERSLSCPPCVRCGQPTALSPFPDAFAYALEEPNPVLSPRLESLLHALPSHAAATTHSFTATLEQAAGVTALWVEGPLLGGSELARLASLPAVGGATALVLRRVTAADAAGLAGLLAALEALPPQTVVAEVPLPVLAVLSRAAPEDQARIKLVSAWSSASCAGCGTFFELGLRGRTLAAYCARQPVKVTCPTCRRPGEVVRSTELLELLTQLPLVPAPKLVGPYLDERPAGHVPTPPREPEAVLMGELEPEPEEILASADEAPAVIDEPEELLASADDPPLDPTS